METDNDKVTLIYRSLASILSPVIYLSTTGKREEWSITCNHIFGTLYWFFGQMNIMHTNSVMPLHAYLVPSRLHSLGDVLLIHTAAAEITFDVGKSSKVGTSYCPCENVEVVSSFFPSLHSALSHSLPSLSVFALYTYIHKRSIPHQRQ
jgi:hypothetical protein